MAKSQQEINYENALAEKDKAQKNLSEANNNVNNQQLAIQTSQSNYDAIGKYDCGSGIMYYESQDLINTLTTLANTLGCAKAYQVAQGSPSQAKGVQLLAVLEQEKSQLTTYQQAVQTAKTAYDTATQNASNAYNDWLEWKKSNMSASELQEFLDVQQALEGGKLRMSAWKWFAIGGGVLLFAWLGFRIWKRAKNK